MSIVRNVRNAGPVISKYGRGLVAASGLYHTGKNVYNAGKQVYEAGKSIKRKLAKSHDSGPPRKKSARAGGGYSVGVSTRDSKMSKWKKAKPKVIRSVTNAKSKKKVKVSASFRKKVKAVAETLKPKGQFTGINTEYYYQTADNQQLVKYLGNDSNSAGNHGLFSPLKVLDAASVLFNGKASSEFNVNYLTPDNFNVSNAKITVVNSFVKYRLRNNTVRTYEGTIYECSPKSSCQSNTTEPVAAWNTGLADEYVFVAGAQETGQTQPANSFINHAGSLGLGNIFASPKQCNSFNQMFNCIERKVCLEPGQTMDFVVQGPRDYTYDYSKYWNTTYFLNVQKMNRYLFFGLNLDLVVANSGNAGRFGQTVNLDGHFQGIVCEQTEYFTIEMPEQAGFYQNVAGAGIVAGNPQNLNLRHQAKYFINRNPTGPFGIVDRVDEEQPNPIETIV